MIKEVKTGDSLRADISTVAFGGNGIARIDNIVAFIPFTVDGDVVDATVTEVKKNFIRGDLKEIVEPSQHRVEPRCAYYSICGGCQYQHISYDHQLAIKEGQVKESFERIGKLPDPPVREIIPSPSIFNYRGKAEFHCDLKQKKIGFMDVAGATLVDIENCPLLDDSINEEFGKLRSQVLSDEGGQFHGRRCILWSGTPYRSDKYITRRVMERDFRIPYTGFSQANTALTDRLVEDVIAMVDASPSNVILDCYSGSGLFSLHLAEHAERIYGIEIDNKAVECARHNAKYYSYKNAKFLKGSAGEILKRKFIRGKIRIDMILLDPPREGCPRGVLDRLSLLKPSKIIYISCNPATQARDIKYLIEYGFSLKVLQPIDMFPQTKHIEVIALLEKNS